MTESVSDSGTEDVLSSIRKLVSTAPSPSFVPKRAPRSDEGSRPSVTPTAPHGSDRLLLTPALRVADPEAEPEPLPPAPRGLSLEDRIAELEAAVAGRSDDFEPDGSELGHVAPPDDLLRAVEDTEIVENAADAAAAREGDPDPVVEDAPFTEAVIEDRPAATPLFFTRHDHMDIRPAAPDMAEKVPSGENQPAPELAGTDDATDESPLPASQETVLSTETDQSESTPLPEFRHEDPVPKIGDNSRMFASEPGAEVDDATLRAFVAMVLNDELQGELGEKITRNLRKLVRREVERALTLRDYD